MASDSGLSASRRGAVLGLLAAALFGLSTPVAKQLLTELSPVVLAGLLYLGAGVGLSAYRGFKPASDEARFRRSDIPALLGVILLGGALGPVLLLIGLNQVTAVAGSLLLNLEAPFTILIAVLLFREHLGRRTAIAALFIVGGAAVLELDQGAARADLGGALSIAGACLCWGLDNNLTQRLTLRDPFTIVRLKALGAGTLNLALGLGLGGTLPRASLLLAALAVGGLSYGVSVVLDAYALRLVGAAREAAYFATAPFFGALASTAILGERFSKFDATAMGFMAAGVAILLRERHGHPHAHDALEHDHVHVHDEHHQHEHEPGHPPAEPHAHPHRHVALVHDHPHVPDLHHRHRH